MHYLIVCVYTLTRTVMNCLAPLCLAPTPLKILDRCFLCKHTLTRAVINSLDTIVPCTFSLDNP